MLKIENVNDQKIYYIKNKYLCECGLLNEKNGIYVTCSMYDEFKSLEEKQYNCESYIINSDVKEWY